MPSLCVAASALFFRSAVKCQLPIDSQHMALHFLHRSALTTLGTVKRAWLVVALVMGTAACNPVFNWREVRPDETSLSLLLPCKPDLTRRSVPLGGRPTELAMLGCDAGGSTFALAVATLPDAGQIAAVQAGWESATLANMKAVGPSQTTFLKLPGASPQPPAILVQATGRRANGRPVHSQSAYFAQGRQIFQAVIYADTLQPEVSDTFFSSLKFE
jgi:hypothetical protein